MPKKYYHEWLVEKFAALPDEQLLSPVFKLGSYNWRVQLDPRHVKAPRTYLSLFLEAVDVARTKVPPVVFRLAVKNWVDSKKDRSMRASNSTFTVQTQTLGWAELMPCSQITTNDGFLRRHDGALLVAVEVELPDEAAAGAPSTVGDDVCIKDCAARQDIGSDLLSLLDNPGPTADLTLIATAGSSASRSGADTASSTEEEPPAKKAKTDAGNEAGAAGGLGPVTAGSPESRRFEVHRAILAARCPYFATLFASGMADSDTRELPLPDTDPDALAALLRFMYGGELALASRHQTRTCLVLADRLLLPKAVALLREQLLSSLSPGTIMADLIWAAGPGGQEAALLRELMDFAAEVVADLPEPELKQLAAAQPALMTQLLLASVRAAKRSRS